MWHRMILLLLFASIVSVSGVSQADDVGKVRDWTGLLGTSQFGVFSKDGSRLVYAIGNGACIVDVEDETKVIRLNGHSKAVFAARFSGDGKKVVTVGQDETIRAWNAESGKLTMEMNANTGDFGNVLLVAQNGNRVALSTGKDRMLRIVDLDKKTELQRIGLTDNEVVFLSVTVDGRLAMSNGITNVTKIWDTTSGREFNIDNGHHNYCGQFTHDGARAVLAGGFSWEIWDLRRKAKLLAGTVTGGHVYAVATTPKTNRLLTGLADGTIWIWDTNTGKEIFVLRGHNSPLQAVMISPDGRYAVSQDSEKAIILWKLPK